MADEWSRYRVKGPQSRQTNSEPSAGSAAPNNDGWNRYRSKPAVLNRPGLTPDESWEEGTRRELNRQYIEMGPSRRARVGAHNIANAIPLVRRIPGVSSIAPEEDVELANRARPGLTSFERGYGQGLPFAFTRGLMPNIATGAGLEGGDALASGQDGLNSAIAAAVGGASGAGAHYGSRLLGAGTGYAVSGARNLPINLSRVLDRNNPLHGSTAPARNAVTDRIMSDEALQRQASQNLPQSYLNAFPRATMTEVSGELGLGAQTAREAADVLNAQISMNTLNKPYRVPNTENIVDVRNIPQMATGDFTGLIPSPLARLAQHMSARRNEANLQRAADTAVGADRIYNITGPDAARALNDLYRVGRRSQSSHEVFSNPQMLAIMQVLLQGANPAIDHSRTPMTLTGQ